MSDKHVDYSSYEDTPHEGACVCMKFFTTGGVCPSCEDNNKKPIPLQIQPVSCRVYRGMLFQGELYSK